eukprot:2701007-Pleurochrysis_carterae.AAC.1
MNGKRRPVDGRRHAAKQRRRARRGADKGGLKPSRKTATKLGWTMGMMQRRLRIAKAPMHARA